MKSGRTRRRVLVILGIDLVVGGIFLRLEGGGGGGGILLWLEEGGGGDISRAILWQSVAARNDSISSAQFHKCTSADTHCCGNMERVFDTARGAMTNLC